MANSVKGSKQFEMRVVPHRPGLRALQAAVLIMTVAGISATSYLMGRIGADAPAYLPEDWQGLLLEQTRLEIENEELNRKLATLESADARDQPAIDESDNTGLSIARLDIDPTGELSRYRYRLVLRQRDADGDTWLTGHVRIELAGRVGTQPASIPLGDPAAKSETQEIFLRFKYFQNVEGEFTLPEGFIPEAVKVEAISIAPVAKTVAQEFNWIATRG